MSLMRRVGLLAGATALSLTGVGAATPATDATTEEMRAQIQALTQRVQELESNKGEIWLTEQRANEVRALVQDVLADADTRASLLGSGMTAGYDDGFRIGSADGNFALRINGQLQSRWIWSYQSDGSAADGDRHRSGSEVARARLWFTGHVVDPGWQYYLMVDFSGRGDPGSGINPDGIAFLQDAYIRRDLGNGFGITVGQFKAPFMREFLVDSRYQQAVERTLFVSNFNVGRTKGLLVDFEQDMFRLAGSWNAGAFQSNSPWNQGPFLGSTEYSFTVRGELLAMGDWDQFEEFRSPPGEQMGLLVGAAVHWQKIEHGVTGVNNVETVSFTADGSLKLGPGNVFASFVYRNVDLDIPGASDLDQWGFTIQGGYHFTSDWEAFIRYEWADFDTPGVADLSILTWGVNHYYAGHQVKATVDMGYAFNNIAFSDNASTGFRADMPDDDGQFVIRTQLQLLF